MALKAAKDCSKSSSQMRVMTVEEKGRRNKRKFLADPLLADPYKIFPSPPNECTIGDSPKSMNENSCDKCCKSHNNKPDALKFNLGLACMVETFEMGPSQPQEETEASSNEFKYADWSQLTESQLEELVLNDLDTIFKSAIKKIIASGYSEEIATKAVFRSGLCYGCNDTASNIVDNTLAFLRSGGDIDPLRKHCFEYLQQMENTGDAMWCLLISDMNVSRACAVDSDALGSFLREATANEDSSNSVQLQSRAKPKTAYAHNSPSEPPNKVSSHDGHIFQSETPIIADVPNLKQETSFSHNGLVSAKECQNPLSSTDNKLLTVAGISCPAVAEEKFLSSREVSGITKREHILRQKSMHLEKHYRTHGSKGASRARKPNSFSGLDKKLKAVADSTGVNVENPPIKTSEAVCFNVPQNCNNYNLSTSTEFTSVPTFSMEAANYNLSTRSEIISVPTFSLEATNGSLSLPQSSILSSLAVVPVNPVPSLPVADSELSLSLPANIVSNSIPISYDVKTVCCSYAAVLNNKSLGQWVPLYKKVAMIMKLVQRVRETQNQLHERTECVNQKVMHAASRLNQDKVELESLRQEREEVERLKKDKKILKENTMKKLSEMENAMFKASGQVERANFAVRRLHFENAALRQEMEAAKLHATESAASFQEVSKREKLTLMKFQLREKQKSLLWEEFVGEKCKLIRLQQELKEAKNVQDQVEMLC
ncbi:Hypothetical predicted protein [Olea europaea subsp. europaea]|uniref:PIR2-like helical domain-containing protein n=1 Tax=Olea europaea subsp. europaea TaxID=158383 RepID=A0A8S0UW75_OLEEU|nr:Hypothetical predicted protein [Olea europaea subsp. europaea]